MDNGVAKTADLGRLVRELRTGEGLSQEELAHVSGVSVRTVADVERGRSRGPQQRTIVALANGLGLDAAGAERLEQLARPGRLRHANRLTGMPTPGGHSLVLPRDLRDFTARESAVEELFHLAGRAVGGGAGGPVAVVCGQPGLGKTSFAVHAAHRLALRFPDGQFALDLRGTSSRPVGIRDALGRLLRAVGVAEGEVPASEEDRSGLLRSVTAGRKALFLFDNAANETQVRALLPSGGTTMTIVTSRRVLAGLGAVHRIGLPLLSSGEAVSLLARIIGEERIEAEEQAAQDLVGLCGCLPLAVRIAGEHLASRHQERVSKLVARLSKQERRLDGLRAGDLEVRAAFVVSYQNLSSDVRKVFRRSSLASGPDTGVETLALLAGLHVPVVTRCAEELVDAGLFHPDPAFERYRCHDLIALFAAERAAQEDGPQRCTVALERTDVWMLRRATEAALCFGGGGRTAAPADPAAGYGFEGRAAAGAWLEAERAQWFAALNRARKAGYDREVVDAADAMHWYSDGHQHWEEWPDVFRAGVASARALGSLEKEAVLLNHLAWSFSMCLRDHPAALEAADAALAVGRQCGDRLQEGWALGYGAGALYRLGQTGEAFGRFRRAADCFASLPLPQARLGELTTLNTLGNHLRSAGRAGEALAVHRRSESICRAGIDVRCPELVSLYGAYVGQQIGNDLAALGRHAEAEAMLRNALAHFILVRAPMRTAAARLDLGLVLYALGLSEARAVLGTAREELERLGHPRLPEAAVALKDLQGPSIPAQ
ncbi:helix-turn-helix domain-containing protein [Streptomyces tsukubensis]|uniref:helix-turn-helix domain-containing protein n=1 Tax=Streptomyces tsukubensis TaxID=83656 RepID=UPI00344D0324